VLTDTVGVVGAKVRQRYLRLGIVDGCCSTTSRVSDGDLQGCHCTVDDVVPFALFTTTDLSAADLSQYSAMLNLARSKVNWSRHDLVMGNMNDFAPRYVSSKNTALLVKYSIILDSGYDLRK